MTDKQPAALRPADLDVSVVIPVFNEVGNVGPLAAEVAQAMDGLDQTWELIYVDDGSSDGTPEACADLDVRLLVHPVNQGQSAATLTGVWAARGRTIVTLDGDRQNDPASIPDLLAALKDHDVAQGIRAKRNDAFSRRFASRVAYLAHHLVWGDGIVDIGCSLRAFPRSEGLRLPAFNGVHRLMGAVFVFRGLSVKQVMTQHRPRVEGVSKYGNVSRGLRGIFDLIGLFWLKRRLLRTAPAPKLIPQRSPLECRQAS